MRDLNEILAEVRGKIAAACARTGRDPADDRASAGHERRLRGRRRGGGDVAPAWHGAFRGASEGQGRPRGGG